MKYLMTMLTVLLVSGYAYGADRMGGSPSGNDKMITNDDLQSTSPDSDSRTFNQMPATEGSQGSAAGGVSNDSDAMSNESDQGSKPADKTMEPGKGPDTETPGSRWDPYEMPGY